MHYQSEICPDLQPINSLPASSIGLVLLLSFAMASAYIFRCFYMVCPKYSHVRTSSDCRQDWVCLVEREDNVIMEHLGRWKQSKRKINQSSDSGESLLEYEDFVIHEYIMVCGEKN